VGSNPATSIAETVGITAFQRFFVAFSKRKIEQNSVKNEK